MLFGAFEKLLNHPVADLDDPIVPILEDGAHWDGQILPFYVKWCNLTVPISSILWHGHYRIDEIVPRVVQGRFRCFEKQHTSHTDLPFGKIGRHMGSKCCPCPGMGSCFQKWCCDQHPKQVLALQYSGAGVGSESGDPLTLWRPLTRL